MGKKFLLCLGMILFSSMPLLAQEDATGAKPAVNAFAMTSAAFLEGGPIPDLYTCRGADINPPLEIKNIPPGTRSMALTVVSPDNPIMEWTHWLVYNIPPKTQLVKENTVPGTQALNDFGNFYFGGPCVFDAKEHRFIFTLYALNEYLDDVTEGATRDVLEKAMVGKIIAKAQLTGTYQNPLWGKDDDSL